MYKKLLLVLMMLISFSLYGQETVRIASYNVKQFPNSNNAAAELKIVLNQIKPTILMTTELDGSTAVTQFLNNILSPKYKASTEVSISWGNGNECAVFYIDSLITYLGSKMITATTRPIAEFKFVHKFTKDTLIIFGVHLKANTSGDNTPNITKRASAVDSLRRRTTQMNGITNYMVVGDFNILTSTEPAMTKLTDTSFPGFFIDMLNVTGNWNKNPQLAQYCTWSTRSGNNTRFDMILISKAINEPGGIDYISSSFKIFGNDGNHFYNSVNSGYNSWFPNDASTGIALNNASDHFPIYADFTFGVPTSVSTTESLPSTFELNQNYPNPFNPETVICYRLSVMSRVRLSVFDLLGREVALLVDKEQEPGNYNSKFSIRRFQLPSGIYFYQLKADNFIQTKKMVLLK